MNIRMANRRAQRSSRRQTSRIPSAICCLVVGLMMVAVPLDRAFGKEETAAPLQQLDPADFDSAAANHLLNRAGFGGTPEQIEALHAMGLERAVARLFNGSAGDPVGDFESSAILRPERGAFRNLSEKERRQLQQKFRRADQSQFKQLQAWWFRRMVLSPHPLQEKMTLFWHGHFATSQRDVRNSHHMYLQNETLRENALGNFKELVTAVAKDPAMLRYLDNNRNTRNKPNENFARELMELFTLGVGNYTEEDIKESARALTGWTFRGNEFAFARFLHDPDEKTFLGEKGRFDGDDVIDIIFQQPAASRFIVRTLYAFYVHEEAADEVIESLAATLRENDFDVRPVMAEIFHSADFYSPRVQGSQISSPVQLLARTLRLLELDPGESPMLPYLAAQMGQDIFLPPSVKGWDGGQAWISTSTLFDRYNFAMPILGLVGNQQMRRRIPGGISRGMISSDALPRFKAQTGAALLLGADHEQLSTEEIVDRLLERFLLVPLPDEDRQQLVEFYDQGLPTFRLQELIHLIVSSPQYQLS